jgi:type IV secretion system protein VirD4
MSNGIILGHISAKPSLWRGIKGLFDRRLPANRAVRRFLAACQRKQQKHLVRLARAIHSIIVAPVGVGKSTGVAIPWLLTCNESAVVMDFKGELAKITAGARRKMGHRIVLLDLFKIMAQEPDTYNALQFIDPDSPTALDECRDLAEALVIKTGQEREPYWNASAEIYMASLIAFVVCFADEADRNLQSVRTVLADPARLEAAIKMMCESKAWAGMLARLGQQLGHYVDRNKESVLAVVNQHLRFLDTLAVAASTKQSSFDPADLLTGKMTVYLILPPEHMRAQSALLRLWIASMLRAVVKGGLQEKTKVHFVLDEAASLGHMEALDDAVDKYRGYGIRLQLYYQSLGQLKKCWPEGQDQTVLSNTTQIFFGVNDPNTAGYISQRLGKETILVEGWNDGETWSSQPSQHGSSSGSHSRSRSRDFKQQPRELLQVDEVMNLHERIAITFTPGKPPIWTSLCAHEDS